MSYYDCARNFTHSSASKPLVGGISTYVGNPDTEYVATYQAGATLRGISITLSPDYFREYLTRRFGSIPDIYHAFAAIDQQRNFPELVSLLKQARAYQGKGLVARLYYEGIISEALSLVIDRAARLEKQSRCPCVRLSYTDKQNLDKLITFIADHPSAELSCETLARKVCMGQTKFKTTFKTRFGISPASYVARTRIEKARELLLESDLPIAQIAHLSGYRKPGAFSEAFLRHMGVLPSALRPKKLR